jgi:HEAT repeat protein
MNKRPAAHIAGLLCLVLLAAALGAEEPEPAYLGKPLSHWLALLRAEPKDPKKPEAEWSRAPTALAHIGEPAVDGVIAALRDPSASNRRRAAVSLLAMGPKAGSAAPALVKALADAAVPVRQTAAAALGATGVATDEVAAALISALKDREAAVRESAATSLGRLRVKAAVTDLEATHADPNAAVREAARKALGRIRGPETTPSPSASPDPPSSGAR